MTDTMKTEPKFHDRSQWAFTLIELLTVIAIMGIIAALVVTMGQAAAQTKKKAAVQGELGRLKVMIDNYYNKLNYYPLDNGGLVSNTAYPLIYDALAATNPLIYELTGATNNALVTAKGPEMSVFNSTNANYYLKAEAYQSIFNRGGVANGDTAEPHDFFVPGPTPKEVGIYYGKSDPPVCGLLVPVDFTSALTPNFWHYDSSTTNRHNLNSYDLWAEYSIGSKNGQLILITNGNW